MERIVKYILSIIFFVNAASAVIIEPRLYGKWEYVGFQYQGNYYHTNPNLHVVFNFESEDRLRLSWTRDDDQSHCARLAEYKISDDVLYQKVIWLDPENSFGCSSDPDMVLGQVSETQFSTSENVLNLYLSLNGEQLIYILNRL